MDALEGQLEEAAVAKMIQHADASGQVSFQVHPRPRPHPHCTRRHWPSPSISPSPSRPRLSDLQAYHAGRDGQWIRQEQAGRARRAASQGIVHCVVGAWLYGRGQPSTPRGRLRARSLGGLPARQARPGGRVPPPPTDCDYLAGQGTGQGTVFYSTGREGAQSRTRSRPAATVGRRAGWGGRAGGGREEAGIDKQGRAGAANEEDRNEPALVRDVEWNPAPATSGGSGGSESRT